MSTQTEQTEPQPTKPIEQHKWLENLLGEWNVTTSMIMAPGEPEVTCESSETVRSLGGLWSVAENIGEMPGGAKATSYTVLGYDVSFNEYRGCFYGDMSSHLWKYVGTLSADGKIMTLDCEGPSMVVDGETANYRDVIELIDSNNRTMTSYGQDDKGEWQQFMKSHYTRV
ncbi:MAG: DUF1579 domain-containing protein [Fimbriimonadaceae bacterium]|nr:DUF1579 domain-containing protein [Fimbriimonadaceae bacterium]